MQVGIAASIKRRLSLVVPSASLSPCPLVTPVIELEGGGTIIFSSGAWLLPTHRQYLEISPDRQMLLAV